MTLSTSAATADSSTDSGSLLGGVTSSVSSLSAPLIGAASPAGTKAPVAVTVPAAPAATSAELLEPLVGSLANTADQLVAAAPVVKSVVPSGTVSAVTVPVAAIADGAVAGLVDAAVPPLVEAVPILEPVVQPGADFVTGATPLPAVLPGVLDASGNLPGALASDAAAPQTDSEVSAVFVPDHADTFVDEAAGSSGTSLARTGSSGAASPGAFFQQAATDAPLTEDPTHSPVPAPAAPGSGAGGGASPSGQS
ncbi:MAG: hypothetical protein ABI568_11760, partial [Pseudarthrobacter sp.]